MLLSVKNWTALHYAAANDRVDVAKVLIQNGADVNAVTESKSTALNYSISTYGTGAPHCALYLLCFGAEINEMAINDDRFVLIRPIHDRLTSLREGNGMKTTLMSKEERRFMWNLAFFFTIKHGGATGFKSFITMRSLITYHGIFMGPGYDRGEESFWRK